MKGHHWLALQDHVWLRHKTQWPHVFIFGKLSLSASVLLPDMPSGETECNTQFQRSQSTKPLHGWSPGCAQGSSVVKSPTICPTNLFLTILTFAFASKIVQNILLSEESHIQWLTGVSFQTLANSKAQTGNSVGEILRGRVPAVLVNCNTGTYFSSATTPTGDGQLLFHSLVARLLRGQGSFSHCAQMVPVKSHDFSRPLVEKGVVWLNRAIFVRWEPFSTRMRTHTTAFVSA